MRKPLTGAVALLLLVLAAADPARAEADGPDFYRVVGVAQDDVLNVRARPTHRSRIVGAIPPNARRVRNLGDCVGGLTLQQWQQATPAQRRRARFQRWCRVQWRNTSGWVNAGYLAEDSGN